MPNDLSTVKQAVKYPWNDGESAIPLVIGGILTLLSPLIIPAVFVLGYLLRVIDTRLDGQPVPPPFDQWRSLFRDGLKAAVVLVIYVVIPLLVGLVVLAAIAGVGGFRFNGPFLFRRSLTAGGLTLVVALLFAGLSLVVAYVTPAALVRLARTGRLRTALTVDAVRDLAEEDAYGAAWLIALAVFAAAGVVIAILNAAATGIIVSGFVTFYALVAMAYLYAHGAEATGISLEEPDESAADAEPESE